MIDMKLDASAKDSSANTMLADEPQMDKPEYPYGLRISLDNDTLKKLGMTELPAIDQEFKLTALCCTVSVSMDEVQGGQERQTVELQIEMMDLAKAQEEPGESADTKTPAERMFGKS